MPNLPEGRPLRVLITNRILAYRTGTELYARDLAIGLLKRGHLPIVYSPILGKVAAEIHAATIPVVDDLSTIANPPDVIHGHHNFETLCALLAFPGVPAVAFCHAWSGWADEPLRFPRVLRYIAVDRTCRDRLSYRHAIPDEQIRLAFNAVDLARFPTRTPLPSTPRRALVFSNNAGNNSYLSVVREACARAGITVDVKGISARSVSDAPETILGDYDIVFAKARAALEAMAVGSAVVLCDMGGAGPMVTQANLRDLRQLNFGVRALRDPVTVEGLTHAIAHYDAADASAVSREVRKIASTDLLLDDLLAIYEEVIVEQAGRTPDLVLEEHAAATYLQKQGRRLYDHDVFRNVFTVLLRKPVIGGLLRRQALGRADGHWLRHLMQSTDRE